MTYVSIQLIMITALLTVASTSVCAEAVDQESTVDDYSDCMAKRHYREVADALDSGFDEVFAARLGKLPPDGCDRDAENLTASKLRGPLFAAMYRRFAPRAGSAASNILRGWVPPLKENDARFGWYALSNCLVRNEADATREWIIAKPSSDVATRKMRKVVEVLPMCLPADEQFEISASVLKGLIAETVYQIDFATLNGDRKRFWG